MSPNGRPLEILVVDDHEPTRRLVRETLEGEGMEVVEAATGDGAREALRLNLVDAIVLDHQLEQETGLDLLPDLQRIDPSPPIVFLTGEGSEAVAQEALSLGAVEYIVKGPEALRRLPGTLRSAEEAWSGLGPMASVEPLTFEGRTSSGEPLVESLAKNPKVRCVAVLEANEVVEHETSDPELKGMVHKVAPAVVDGARALTGPVDGDDEAAHTLARVGPRAAWVMGFAGERTVLCVLDRDVDPVEILSVARQVWSAFPSGQDSPGSP